jgi:hypothetical protein
MAQLIEHTEFQEQVLRVSALLRAIFDFHFGQVWPGFDLHTNTMKQQSSMRAIIPVSFLFFPSQPMELELAHC